MDGMRGDCRVRRRPCAPPSTAGARSTDRPAGPVGVAGSLASRRCASPPAAATTPTSSAHGCGHCSRSATGRGGWLPDDLERRLAATSPARTTGRWRWDARRRRPAAPRTAARRGSAGTGHRDRRSAGTRAAPVRRSLWLAGLLAALLLARLDVAGPAHASSRCPTSAPPARPPTRRPPTPPVGEAAETSTTVVVSVVGLVARPGLVTLPTGARVADAIEAAGGLLPEADPASVNLAAVVADGAADRRRGAGCGRRRRVGGTGAAGSAGAARPQHRRGRRARRAARASARSSPSGSSTTARARARSPSVDQLDDVPGIGPAIAAELAELVTV